MILNYWSELDFVWHAISITVLSIAIVVCWVTSLCQYSDFFRNDVRNTKLRFYSIQILILSILTITLMFVNDSFAKDDPHRNAKVESILGNYWNDRKFYSHFWNTLQSTYKCCGVSGSDDWGSCVPLSCYQTKSTWQQITTCKYAHDTGCYKVIVKYLDDMTAWFKFIGLSFVSLGVFGIVGILLALFLSSIFGQKKNQTSKLNSSIQSLPTV